MNQSIASVCSPLQPRRHRTESAFEWRERQKSAETPEGYVPSADLGITRHARDRSRFEGSLLPEQHPKLDIYAGTNAIFVKDDWHWQGEYRGPDQLGSRRCKQLRNERNRLPAVLFRRDCPNRGVINLTLDASVVQALADKWRQAMQSRVITISIDGYDKPFKCIIQGMTTHPVTGKVLNLSMQTFVANQKYNIDMPVELINDRANPDQNLVVQFGHTVRMRWQGGEKIPTLLQVDVLELENGQLVRARDLILPRGLTIRHPKHDNVICAVEGEFGVEGGEGAEDDDGVEVDEATRLQLAADQAKQAFLDANNAMLAEKARSKKKKK